MKIILPIIMDAFWSWYNKNAKKMYIKQIYIYVTKLFRHKVMLKPNVPDQTSF